PEPAGGEILQHDVGNGAQRLQLREACGILQINRDRPLVAVDRREILAERRPAVGRGERRPAAHAVAARRILHLDDVGAEIGEQRAPERGPPAICPKSSPRPPASGPWLLPLPDPLMPACPPGTPSNA